MRIRDVLRELRRLARKTRSMRAAAGAARGKSLVQFVVPIVVLAAVLSTAVVVGPLFVRAPARQDLSGLPALEKAQALRAPKDGYLEVETFYGTDRKPTTDVVVREAESSGTKFKWAGAMLVLSYVLYLAFRGLRKPADKPRRWARRLAWFPGGAAAVSLVAAVSYAWAGVALIVTPGIVAPPDFGYGSERGEPGYGRCYVSIPNSHVMGNLEAPSLLRFEVHEDPAKHVVLLAVVPETHDEFFAALPKRVGRVAHRELYVFIHGYNVSFELAARRTAQLARDLDYRGVPMFYRWPSEGDPIGYVGDGTSADDAAVPQVAAFIKEITETVEKEAPGDPVEIHLVAHSRGSQCLRNALEQIKSDLGRMPSSIREVVFAAPDIDAAAFREWIPRLLALVPRVTLYVSSTDMPLHGSEWVNRGPRAGEAGADVVVVAPMETIDATVVDDSFLGHSYVLESPAAIGDLFALFENGLRAANRFGLEPVAPDGRPYWKFKAR